MGSRIGDGNTWRTLSIKEWVYLFENHVYVWGQCNSVNGCFIAPDGFSGDESALTSAVSDWTSAEAAGVVFLPAAGYRYDDFVGDVDCLGHYWSSSAYNSAYVYFVSPRKNGLYTDYDCRDLCCSIRLVTEVE